MFGIEKTLKYKGEIFQTVGLLFIKLNKEKLTKKEKTKVLKKLGFNEEDTKYLIGKYSY